jgi:hypothetical protein
MKDNRPIARLLVVVGCTLFASGQTSPSEYSFTISDSQVWTDTGVDLSPGQTLTLTAETKSGSDRKCNPGGFSETAGDSKIPLTAAPVGALIARTSEKSEAKLVGTGTSFKIDSAGHLFLGINENAPSKCSFAVVLSVTQEQNGAATPATRDLKQQLSSAASVWLKGQIGSSSSGTTTSSNAVAGNGNAAPASSSSAGLRVPEVILDRDLRQDLDSLPRRVHDHAGNLGDMVNFVIIGNEDRMKAGLDAADWHLADVDSKEAGLKAIMNTYEKKDYLEMPMSHLYLWDRMQDFGYEQAQAFSVVASRHHFRLWKAPFAWNNEIVYVGAATHDIGFEKDVRTGKLTHKIDPNVDDERSNLAQGLEKSGKAKSITYYLPPNPVEEAKNASGGGYHSDGRLLVVFLK